MVERAYFLVSGIVFLVIGLAHLSRLVTGWTMSFAGWDVPHWFSIPGLVVPGLLSALGFALASRGRSAA